MSALDDPEGVTRPTMTAATHRIEITIVEITSATTDQTTDKTEVTREIE